jgi:FtsZ-binding cell division protein ZapB
MNDLAEQTTSQNGAYVRKGIYTLEQILSKVIRSKPGMPPKSEESKVDFDGDLIYMDSDRYWTFIEKGNQCYECGIEGTFFAKERSLTKIPPLREQFHFNLYAIDTDGIEVLMTKDHILPVAQGGAHHLDNYHTMCTRCNCEKGNMNDEQWKIYKSLKAGFLKFNDDQLQNHLKIAVDTIKLLQFALHQQHLPKREFNKNDAYKNACILATAIRRIVESRKGIELKGGQNIWQAPIIKIN